MCAYSPNPATRGDVRLSRDGITAVASVPVGKDPSALATWLRKELTSRGYDLQKGGQSLFARESGVNVSSINKTLNENRVPEIEQLRRMGRALGYTLGEMLVHAGLATPDELPTRRSASHEVLDDLRREAAGEGKTVGEILLDRGMDADQLVIPDAPPADPQIAEIEALDIPNTAKARMIRMYLENRAFRFEEARLKAKERKGRAE